MSGTLTLDVNLSLEAQAGKGGLRRDELAALEGRAAQAVRTLFSEREAGNRAFLDLPADSIAAQAVKALGRELQSQFENVVVLGIGGSALGPKALFTGLGHPLHNLQPAASRRGARLFFPDSPDPTTLTALLDVLDISKTAVVAITKSGGTAETLAQLLVLKDRIAQAGGAAAIKHQIVAVTDPEKGALRAIAREEGWRTLPVPPGVGGRFSVLTPVGLLPAAAASIDVDGLLAGAGAMVERCTSESIYKNPGALLGTVLYALDTAKGRNVHVFMPYVDSLRETSDWFVQLWAESLGKKLPAGGSVGPTPMRAVGPVDQHSLLQLLMEGPANKAVLFLGVESVARDVSIPKEYPSHPEATYLGGHSLHELVSVERRATAAALAAHGRPSVNLTLPKLDAYGMGQLMMLLQIATAVAGSLYGINTFDQPGVEAGKRYASGLLGRAGYEAARQELEARPKADPQWVL